ncbi:MAG: tRNA (adenosine(37)-N6)-threonylcarbamoyltransferase complex dimerization subunit type 1 TsaB [Moraxellaceae bacterium]|nr:tRNA (adenosine(37)-N6)-threonylcarbamoyltransferase complex dimerization subunit type 1 TsaB [Moraxellaceae bacterium]
MTISAPILAIDTVFDKCGIAILQNDKIIYQDEQFGKRQQTQQILPMIEKALQTVNLTLNELSALVFNRGPGAFSGIRINTSVVQALSVACDIPCVAVSSLQVLAQSAWENNSEFNHIYALLDARMQQVYLGEFQLQNGIMQAVSVDNETLLDYGKTTAKNLPLIALASDDKQLLATHKEQTYQEDIEVNASILAKLGVYQFKQQGGFSAELALPVYLRNNAWKTLKEQGK